MLARKGSLDDDADDVDGCCRGATGWGSDLRGILLSAKSSQLVDVVGDRGGWNARSCCEVKIGRTAWREPLRGADTVERAD